MQANNISFDKMNREQIMTLLKDFAINDKHGLIYDYVLNNCKDMLNNYILDHIRKQSREALTATLLQYAADTTEMTKFLASCKMNCLIRMVFMLNISKLPKEQLLVNLTSNNMIWQQTFLGYLNHQTLPQLRSMATELYQKRLGWEYMSNQ